MSINLILLCVVLFSVLMYTLAVHKVRYLSQQFSQQPRSLLRYYGQLAALWCLLPALIFLLAYSFLAPQWLEIQLVEKITQMYPDQASPALSLLQARVSLIAQGLLDSDDDSLTMLADYLNQSRARIDFVRFWLIALVTVAGGAWVFYRVRPAFAARQEFENILRRLFLLAASIAVFTTLAIVASLLFEAIRFFSEYPITDFLFGLHWSPNIALRDDQVGSSGSFGMLPVLAGTLLISLIAMLVSVPIGLYAAIYMSEFADSRVRSVVKPALEVLAGIPTVVYGFFAALIAAPFFRNVGGSIGLDVSSESALAAGVVMGVMIIPFISSLSDDIIRAVPNSLRDAALGLGATRAEMINRVILPAAFPGLVGAFLLAVSRSIGETMIVVMAVGTAANLTLNPLESVTTVTVQIVGLLTGDTEFDSIKTLSAFALGITLFILTLMLNIVALSLSRRLAERYE